MARVRWADAAAVVPPRFPNLHRDLPLQAQMFVGESSARARWGHVDWTALDVSRCMLGDAGVCVVARTSRASPPLPPWMFETIASHSQALSCSALRSPHSRSPHSDRWLSAARRHLPLPLLAGTALKREYGQTGLMHRKGLFGSAIVCRRAIVLWQMQCAMEPSPASAACSR